MSGSLLDGWCALLDGWCALLDGAGGAQAAGEDLLARYAEPHRRYHTGGHLAAVLAIVDEYRDRAADPDAVTLAAWYHDAVYDPTRPDNEERSAVLAESTLPALGVPAGRVGTVARLVRLTAGHDPEPDDRDGILLCDADLAILAAEPARYAAYAQAVREEYAHVPDGAFRDGRAAVLRGLLALPALYRLADLRAAWEDTARANITAELAALTNRVSGGAARTGTAG